MSIVLSTEENIRFQSLLGLKASISERLDRTFSEDDLTDFIYLAERELERVLTVPYREATAPLTISSQTTALPSGFKAVRRIVINADPQWTLEPATPDVLTDNRNWASPGRPQAYAIIAGELWVSPVPDGSYGATIVFERKITALSEASPSNWLLERHPDAYFYGALVQAADFIEDTKKIDRYRAAFDLTVQQINDEGNRYRYSTPARLRNPVAV